VISQRRGGYAGVVRALRAASRREAAPRLASTAETWWSTVFSAMTSRAAINREGGVALEQLHPAIVSLPQAPRRELSART